MGADFDLHDRELHGPIAITALRGQQTVADLRNGCDTSIAWDRLNEVAAAYGWESAPTAAFVIELAKAAIR